MSKDIRTIPLSLIDPEPVPFKKPMAERYLQSLRFSLGRWGVKGVLLVAPLANGRYVIADGTTRLSELQAMGLTEVDCEVCHDLADEAERLLFKATFNRTAKPYDEGELTRTLERLQTTFSLDDLATATARLDLRQRTTAAPSVAPEPTGPALTKTSLGRPPSGATLDVAILTLAGPSALIEEIKLMLPKRLDHIKSLQRIREALLEPFPLEDEDLITVIIHSALLIRQWRGGEP